jgi:hypothetical protein
VVAFSNLVMGLPPKVACSEVAIALGVASLARIMRLMVFVFRRGYTVNCWWLYGGVLLTVAAAGSLCGGHGGGWPAGFRLGACRLGGVVM